ncbi:purine permease 3-like [Typha angustifolia]|uniref:purine permease 3-like n=1 Tax=Typha angustifolia TaxID=59011 RepID=UPI003C2AEA58
MEVESQQLPQPNNEDKRSKFLGRRSLLALNFIIMVIGTAGSPLILRLYFIKGGKRIWLSSWLQTGGWPLILVPLTISYAHRRSCQEITTNLYHMTPSLFLSCVVIGLLTGLDDFFYAYGISYLPVSTSSILISSQLAFTALFSLLLVKQRFTAASVNAVVLLIVGAAILGINSSGDRPEGESKGKYYVGFWMTLGAAALYGLVLPLVELSQMSYARVKQEVTYTLVMEMQLVMGFFGTAFSTVGMLVNKDFLAIPKEAGEFGLGQCGYYMVLLASAVLFQCFFLGTVGAIFYGSALLAGVILAVLIPVTEVLAVVFFDEPFNGSKGVALGLSLWGFASYFYGEFKSKSKKTETDA